MIWPFVKYLWMHEAGIYAMDGITERTWMCLPRPADVSSGITIRWLWAAPF
jgi:hypothetical protein